MKVQVNDYVRFGKSFDCSVVMMRSNFNGGSEHEPIFLWNCFSAAAQTNYLPTEWPIYVPLYLLVILYTYKYCLFSNGIDFEVITVMSDVAVYKCVYKLNEFTFSVMFWRYSKTKCCDKWCDNFFVTFERCVSR